ncbi:hypothetical protein [Methylocapsa sp. S129]|uniref:hypothetical protein n=1 Tax=Methylocapsa sp. S129 TaxID=1641869 RepID=UPI00131E5A4F|nr:hypothetical protein [Methylocapsa sp. S129]
MIVAATLIALDLTLGSTMTRTFTKIGIFGAALSLLLAGCASAPVVSGRVTYARCALDSHTEAFPRNPHPRRAYGCRSNQAGFLSRDERERMRPL